MKNINNSDYKDIYSELLSLGKFLPEIVDENEIKTTKLNNFFSSKSLWKAAKQKTGHAKYTHKYTKTHIGYEAHGVPSVYDNHFKEIKNLLTIHLVGLQKIYQNSDNSLEKKKYLEVFKKNQEWLLNNHAGQKGDSLEEVERESLLKEERENKKLEEMKSSLYKKGKNSRKDLEILLDSLPLWAKITDELNGSIRYQHLISEIVIQFSSNEYQLDNTRSFEIAELLKTHLEILSKS